MKFVRSFGVLFTACAVAVLAMSPASASTAPITWEEGPARSTLEIIGIYVAIPVALYIVITVFGWLTARNNYVPPTIANGAAELDAAEQAELQEAH